MIKKLSLFFASIVLFFILAQDTANAQEIDTSTGAVLIGSSVKLSPAPAEIDGNTEFVVITFGGLEPNKKYHICSRNDGCGKAKDNKTSEANGTLEMKVCGANDNALRRDDCGDKDYFHEGRVYSITLFEDEDQEISGPGVRFLVNHFYPDVKVTSIGGLLRVEISGEPRRPGEQERNRNNYQIVVEGIDQYGNKYKKDKCITLEGGFAIAEFSKENSNPLRLNKGKYLIKINEEVNEGAFGRVKTLNDSCNGGFTYWHINTSIDENGDMPWESSCSVSGESTNGCNKDPNASDIDALNKLIEEFNEISLITLHCDKYSTNANGEYQCSEINTAIGSIPTNPVAFIERLFTIILSVAGVAALGLLIYGGYSYMISRGDPERVKGARETITSAIIGLIFIIFSLLILQVVAGEILNIPGFSSP